MRRAQLPFTGGSQVVRLLLHVYAFSFDVLTCNFHDSHRLLFLLVISAVVNKTLLETVALRIWTIRIIKNMCHVIDLAIWEQVVLEPAR